MTSSSRFSYHSRSKFKFPYFLSNGAEIWHRGQFWGADFEIEPKKSDINTFWRRKWLFFTKNWNFCPSAPWQKCCHGNTLGYCQLKTILNDALYNYTKSQKVSSVYWKPFWHSREKTNVPPAWIGLSFELSCVILQVDYISWWSFELSTCEADGLKNEWEFLLGKTLCVKNLGNGLSTQWRNYILL